MWIALFLLIWIAAIVLLGIAWRGLRAREAAWQRLQSQPSGMEGATVFHSARGALVGTRLRRPWLWVPWAIGVAVLAILWVAVGLSADYSIAMALVVGLLTSQIESMVAGQREARLENQLADAIDIMVGALGAGASVQVAIDAAVLETEAPLRPFMEEVSGRIRLGDDPVEVFRSLADRVPLETFLLFASALGVHWEVGGKLAPTLATVGRTIRDRIEVTRRIRSNIAQSQFSTFAIIGLTYLIALIVWRNGPDQMREFVTSRVGSAFVAGSIVVQAAGIVWMNLISKPRF